MRGKEAKVEKTILAGVPDITRRAKDIEKDIAKLEARQEILMRESEKAQKELDEIHEKYIRDRQRLIPKINGQGTATVDYFGFNYNRELKSIDDQLSNLKSDLYRLSKQGLVPKDLELKPCFELPIEGARFWSRFVWRNKAGDKWYMFSEQEQSYRELKTTPSTKGSWMSELTHRPPGEIAYGIDELGWVVLRGPMERDVWTGNYSPLIVKMSAGIEYQVELYSNSIKTPYKP
jgi:hypothetical protein